MEKSLNRIPIGRGNTLVISFAIGLILMVIHLPWANFNGLEAVDTAGYVDVSKHFYSSDYIHFRPVIYPLLIAFARLFAEGEFGILVILQLLIYCLSAVLFYYILVKEKLFKNHLLAAILVIISFSAPQSMFANQWVLPEMLPLPFLLLLYIFLSKPFSLLNSIMIAILMTVSILTKPLWLLLLAFPALAYIYSNKNSKSSIYRWLLPAILTIMFYSLNQILSVQEGKSKVAASTGDAIINISLLRMGMINGAENTELYHYLESKNLLDDVVKSRWTNKKKDFKRFTELKDAIPWHYREDPNYWRSVLDRPETVSKYLIIKLSRIPIFFSTSAANINVKFLPGFLNSVYQRFYSNIHSKHLVGISFIIFMFLIDLFNFKTFTFLKYLFFLILGTALVLCLLTYQDQNFLRMRAVIEPFIVFSFLTTIVLGIGKIQKRFL